MPYRDASVGLMDRHSIRIVTRGFA